MPRAAHGVPAFVVDSIVLRDIRFVRVQRPVRRRMGQVEEERLVGAATLLDHADRLVGDGVGEIEVGRRNFHPPVVLHDAVGGEEMRDTIHDAVEAVEAALARCRPVHITDAPGVDQAGPEVTAHMPLARHQRAVTRGPQQFGNRRRVVAQETLVRRRSKIGAHVADTGLVRIQAGQQRRARRAATGAVVHRRQQHAVARHAIDMRCVDLGAHHTQVGKTHVVGQDEDDVGAAWVWHGALQS